MLGYKVWWLNRDKQLWEGQGEHEKEKKKRLVFAPTIFVWDYSERSNLFRRQLLFLTVTLTLRSLRTREKAEKRGEELPFLSVPVLSPVLPPVLSLGTDSLRTSPLPDCWINPGKTDSFFKQNAFSFLCWNVIIAILSVIVWKQLNNMLWLRGDDSGILETFSLPTSSTGILVT